ncbi:AI-2E family transporter [Canibacter zhoujuaniae]|uniref:AI-2E family transporter n=1 Tax=Canibacter zhoujuaniae TaxID=2708343 RepID=UPI00141E034D|nr:AI-2E family transporter [Canibacter zhoujuaniae]
MSENQDKTQTPVTKQAGIETQSPAQVPHGVRLAASWSWRLIVIGVAVAALFWLLVQIRVIVVPLLVAILLAALLHPIVSGAQKIGLPKAVGVIAALASLVASVTLLVWLSIRYLQGGFDTLVAKANAEWRHLIEWVDSLGFEFDTSHFNFSFDTVLETVRDNSAPLWNGALGVASSAAAFVTGMLLAIFSLIFLLIDGKRIWYWVLGFLPASAHAPLDAAGNAGWRSVGQYVRVQIFVAFVDAVGIALGAAILGVPFVVPIGITVFLGSFIPFLGAIMTGLFAALIALIYLGPVQALIMVLIAIAVNQIEGHILQPLVMGSAVRVHPLGVVLAVSIGALLAGIPGALFAVPIAAAANSIVNTLVHSNWRELPDPVEAYHQRNKARADAKTRLKRISRAARGKGN